MPESTFMDIIKMPLLAITIMLISFMGFLFNIPLLIPPFAATLFMIYMKEGVNYANTRNVIGGHLIGFGCAFIYPLIVGSLTIFPDIISKAIIVGVSILLAGWLMAILKVQHPPAIATTIIFLHIKKEGILLFGIIPLNALIPFAIGLTLIGVITHFMVKEEISNDFFD